METTHRLSAFCIEHRKNAHDFLALFNAETFTVPLGREIGLETEKALKKGYRLVTPADDEYPRAFLELSDPPAALWVHGHAPWMQNDCISIVGCREPSDEALRWMEQEISLLLKTKKLCVVSGAARGVDQKAHQLAIRSGRPTVMFLPSGIDVPYPKGIEEWFGLVEEGGGAVVSSFRPLSPMRKGYFPARNQLIAAISPMLVVVEARRRSGTSLTAKNAIDLHRTIAVMPTYPNLLGQGGLDLLMEGAAMVRDHLDLLTLCESAYLMNGQG